MNIDYQYGSNSISVSATYEKVEELQLVENVFLQILTACFSDQSVKIITKEPQKYSFGYDIEPHFTITLGKTKFLVNEIADCTANLLSEIVQTEEFKRGLLILIDNKDLPLENVMSDVIKLQKGIQTHSIKGIIAYCEDDGLTLFIYTSILSKDSISSLIK